jgi:hypothetical protein
MYLLYRFLVYIHILSVIVSIGPFFILFPIVKKLQKSKEEEMSVYLDTFQFVVFLAKHAGHVLVGSGILLVISGPWTWHTPWILMTLFTLFCSLLFLARAFSPSLKKLREGNGDRDLLIAKLRRAIWIYLLLLLLMLWFMVGKPTLW